MSDPVLRTIAGDAPEAAEMILLVNLWRQVFATTQAQQGRATPETINPESLSQAMTAAAVMAGTYFGNAIVAGLASDQERRRAKEAFCRNFVTGIDIGKRQGERVVAGMPGARH